MILTITTTHYPASDLSYLLHKHPARVQQVEITAGIGHIFYTEVTEERCTISLLLDIDPIGLVRRRTPGGNDFALDQYVNDRPYVASSFMSAALVAAFSTALNGRCKDKPELVNVAMPLRAEIAVLPVRGGEALLRQLWEPLGYTVEAEQHPIDPNFLDWGMSRYFTVRLSNTVTVQQLLSHLYILIPVCDNDKHYWVGEHEVEKLLEKGKDWLPGHPARELITRRYLKNQGQLANKALLVLMEGDAVPDEVLEEPAPVQRAHDLRLLAVRDELVRVQATSVADLGCGEGKLLRLLLEHKQFTRILGMDVSYRSVEIAKDRLKVERMSPSQQRRLQLIQGSLTYRDRRLEGFDAAALVEVIEHLDESRLAALALAVFAYARPATVVVTTPNSEYNRLFVGFEEGKTRHSDHRWEWTRAEFASWGDSVALAHGYEVVYKPVGEQHAEYGALSQMGVFTRK
jgi:3' terminal RNA ribose 2'-O-methyltransferase Hen1